MKKPPMRLLLITGPVLIGLAIGGGYLVFAKSQDRQAYLEENKEISAEIRHSSTAVSQPELHQASVLAPSPREMPVKENPADPSADKLAISLSSGHFSSVSDVRVKGLTLSEFEDLKRDEQYGLRTRFYLISNSGEIYDFGDGTIGEDVSYDDARITFFAKDNAYDSSETYKLKMELYRYTKGDPSYVLVKNVIKSVQVEIPTKQLMYTGWL